MKDSWPWDIVERNSSVSPVCCMHGSDSSTQSGPLGIIHIQQGSKGTFDEIVGHRARVSRMHRQPLSFRGSPRREHRREDRSLRTVGGRWPTRRPSVYHLTLANHQQNVPPCVALPDRLLTLYSVLGQKSQGQVRAALPEGTVLLMILVNSKVPQAIVAFASANLG